MKNFFFDSTFKENMTVEKNIHTHTHAKKAKAYLDIWKINFEKEKKWGRERWRLQINRLAANYQKDFVA